MIKRRVQKWLRGGYNTRVCQLPIYCLSAPDPSFTASSVEISSEDDKMLNFVSRGRWRNTARRRGFSFHAFPFASSGFYQELLPAVFGGGGGGTAGDRHLHQLSVTSPGWISRELQAPSCQLPASAHLHLEGVSPAGWSLPLLLLFPACPATVDTHPHPHPPREHPRTVAAGLKFNPVWIPPLGRGSTFSLCPFLQTLP